MNRTLSHIKVPGRGAARETSVYCVVMTGPEGLPAAYYSLKGEVPTRSVTSLDEADPGRAAGVLLLSRDLIGGGSLAAVPPHVAVLALDNGSRRIAEAEGRLFLSVADMPDDEAKIRALMAAARYSGVLLEQDRARTQLEGVHGHLRELNQVGMALMSERDPESLLGLILAQARRLTTSDGGSLYLTEEGEDGRELLHFLRAQNDSLPDLPDPDFTLPLDRTSVAGYAASTGEPLIIDDAYEIPEEAPYSFNRGFDEEHGYRAKSMLVVPMKDHKDGVVGVLQLINRKRSPGISIRTEEDADDYVLSYTEQEVEIVSSLAGQAAVSIENGRLYRAIEELFEGFIKAAVTAIDQRDPTTSGHSVRVATLTCDVAEVVDSIHTGPFGSMRFSKEQMRELRYAGLLHDFGKVGVREEVLVKPKKLPSIMLERVRSRFELIKRSLETDLHRRRAEQLLESGTNRFADFLQELEEEFQREMERVTRFEAASVEANEPRLLPEAGAEILDEIAQTTFRNLAGEDVPYISPDEYHYLRIPKGSLDPDERLQIESHVTHTFGFLSQIPWTEDLERVAEIAFGHHEKLNGQGYPRGVSGDEIPIQTRIMTIADIFDALTASDRPYKQAVPLERALGILDMEARDGMLDSGLVELLIESKIYERVLTEDWRDL